ncbi:MAG TPA: hypothetical protein VK783_15545, partial [Bacteroidia bacterium]|nr:hypothetical protein [Bacteroidia bacterium]
IKSEGTAPTFSSTSANHGLTPSGSSVTNGTDTRGVLSFTGTNAGGNSVFTINFNKSYGAAPYVVITSASPGAQACTYYVTSAAGSFTINIAGGGATPSFNYIVIE